MAASGADLTPRGRLDKLQGWGYKLFNAKEIPDFPEPPRPLSVLFVEACP